MLRLFRQRKQVSVSLATVVIGSAYHKFVENWCHAVRRLNTLPEQVLIVTDKPESVRRAAGDLPITIVKRTGGFKYHPVSLLDGPIRDLSSEWICKMDIDDRIRPQAFDQLGQTSEDVYIFGIKYQGPTSGTEPIEILAPKSCAKEILERRTNPVSSGSPYRRWLLAGARYRDMIYEDWAFWIDCAKQNAKFKSSVTIDYDYFRHQHNLTSTTEDAFWRRQVMRLE